MIALGIACATRHPGVIQTEVVTFPKGALVQYQGHALGRAPVKIVLPQDNAGRLTERAEVRAVPNTEQPMLVAQSRLFDPANRADRVPDRIMIDLFLPGSNAVAEALPATTHVETASKRSDSPKRKPLDRGKPTQAIGLDRWNPGIY